MTSPILARSLRPSGWRTLLLLVTLAAGAPTLAATTAHGQQAGVDIRALFERIAVRAIEHGPMARQSAAQIDAAGYDLDEARGRRWPQIDLGVQSALVSPAVNAATPISKAPVTTLSASTVLFDWGRTGSAIEAAEFGLQAARDRHDAKLASIVYDACAAFAAVTRQTELAGLAESYVARMNELVDMLAQIVAVDGGRASELTQARARLLQARSLHEIAQSRVREAQVEMQKLIGESIPPLPPSAPWVLPMPELEQAIAKVAQDPQVLAANADTRAAEKRAEVIKASGMPALNLTVSRPLQKDAYGRPPGWQVGLALNMPLGRGGSINAAAGAAFERARSEAWRRDQLLVDLEYRVRSTHQEAYSLAARALSYADLSVELKKVRDNFFEQWLHLGRRSLLDVLNAQSEHYGNEVSAVSSRYDAYIANLRLLASSGQLVPWVRGDGAMR
ncbi:TolC family protein [Herbaspirillum sp. YR522]|uniref:TolC family protein n=1 Tax=Herbaspirillum sp. YR522 TaxID=1144342 RepID=UPI00026FCD39|nr:TolC family protein [Herbaspirillum sp. YR522]EJN07565.1 outer membrane protein [Herbaspirillum sp. YR522]